MNTKLSSIVAALSFFAIGATFAEETTVVKHWTGAVSGAWNEPGNWLENEVPAAGETASFDRTSANTTIDLTGMTSVTNILFTGADTPSYKLGTGSSQKLVIDPDGWITVDSSVTADQTIAATMYYYTEEKITSSTPKYSIKCQQDSLTATLKLGVYNGPLAGVSGWAGPWSFYYYGSGNVKKSGLDATSGGGCNVRMCKTGGYLEYVANGAFYQIVTDGSGNKQHIVIDSGCTLESSNPNSVLAHGGDNDEIWVSGDGTFYSCDNSKKDVDSAYLGTSAHSGIVTFDCKYKRREANTTTLGFWNPTKYYFNNSANVWGSRIHFHSGGGTKPLYVPTFGSTAVNGALGNGTAEISWTNGNGKVIYTGVGETLYNPLYINYHGQISNDGTGTVRIDSKITSYSSSCKFYLYGGPFEIATDVPAVLNVASGTPYKFANKTGESSSKLTISKIYLNDATTITLEDGVSVFVKEYERSSQNDALKLNIITSTGKLYLGEDFSKGDTPSWIYVNGARSIIGPDGEISSPELVEADSKIDAKGGEISDVDDYVVSIDTAQGSGDNVSLSDSETSVMVLRQNQDVQNAVVELKDGETLNATNIYVASGAKPMRIQAAEDASATLGATTISGGEVELGGTLSVGDTQLGHNGVLKVADGEITGGQILNCPDGTDIGFTKAYYQTGGSVFAKAVGNRVGSSYGMFGFNMSGGAFTFDGSALFGMYGLSSVEMSGGTVIITNGSFTAKSCSGGMFSAYQTGGTVVTTCYGNDFYIGGGANGTSVWTVEGENALLKVRSSKDGRNVVVASGMSSTTSKPAEGILNINDSGTVHAGMILAAKNHSSTSKAYLNFNGGIFYNNYCYGRVFGESGAQYFDPIDRVTVFEKGMIVNTTVECSTIVPIDKPTGKGISSIAWTDTTTTFLTAPLVRIVGDGYGASAVAIFDPDTRTVSSIKVTSHGCNYTQATAQVLYGTSIPSGVKVYQTIECVLADNVSGGFTKTGSGTFTFSATNTYTGATVVEKGTLTLGKDDLIDASSELVLKGGTLNLNGKAQSFASIDCLGGSVKSGSTTTKATVTGMRVDLDEAIEGTYKSIDLAKADFASDAALTIQNYSAEKLAGKHTMVLVKYTGDLPAVDLVMPTLDLPSGWTLFRRGANIILHLKEPLILKLR